MSLFDQDDISNVYDQVVDTLNDVGKSVQYDLDVIHNVKAQIDEVSVLFHSTEAIERFIEWAEGSHRLRHFNSVRRDTAVQTFPRDAHTPRFGVRFEFFEVKGYPWRIEAMQVLDGKAILHQNMGLFDVPHASFKCIDLGHYLHMISMLESGRWIKRAEYQNSYGIFSYFGEGTPYLKPRVNLRD